MVINSRKNERIKFFASLKQKKNRKEYGLYLVEGVKMVRELIKYNQNIQAVIGVSGIIDEFRGYDFEIIEVTDSVLETVCDTVTPQGVVAVVKIPERTFTEITNTCVCLDGVQDAGNLGTILRIMTAVGVKDLYLIDSVDAYLPKTVRSSMSGIFCVNIYETTFEEFKEKLKIPIVIADMDGESVFEFNSDGAFCLLLGSEAHGVSDNAKALAQKTVKIPMKNDLESLNVGVSAGIILYQILKNTF